MAKPRGVTIQQRFGFQDGDLKTPKHDEMMAWLDANAERIIKALYPMKVWETLVQQARKRHIRRLNSYAKDRQENIKPWATLGEFKDPGLKNFKKVWEHPVTSTNTRATYVVGFVDMKVWYDSPSPDVSYPGARTSYGRISYVTDINLAPEWIVSYDTRAICFEIKSSIPSLGELIRQIRMYQTYEKTRFVVVSPDDQFADQLEGQDIGFFKYDGEFK